MSANQQTIINHDIDRPVEGYVLITTPDAGIQREIAELQSMLNERFGGLVWNTPSSALHITLMDWIAPLVDYGEKKKILFEEIFPSYNATFTEILKDYRSITINFTKVVAAQGAIIVIGQDNGEFNDIRCRFLEKIKLPSNTKQPPAIIHSTIARYQKEADLEPIIDFLAQHPLVFTHQVNHFSLVREDIAPQLKYQLLEKYPLS